MKTIITTSFLVFIFFISSIASAQEFYTQTGDDLAWQYIVDNQLLPKGVPSYNGILGSKIDVNEAHPEISSSPYKNRLLLNDRAIHTIGNHSVPKGDFSKWTRWYQEDGNIQIFRLFKGEINYSNTVWYKPRIEAETSNHVMGVNVNNSAEWAEWSATYTVIKPVKSEIFQIWCYDGIQLMINMSGSGEIKCNKRTDPATFLTMVPNATGKSFHVRVRDYGSKWEVYLNDVLFTSKNTPDRKQAAGFRWGLYATGGEVQNDGLMFVTGTQIKYSNDGPPVDTDGDGISDNLDNCPLISNPDQADEDFDKIGDVCDANPGDKDNDGIKDAFDNCPNTANPGQEDADLDKIGDVCDNDSDNDGIANNIDNCPLISNPDQADEDNDKIGDVCDANLGDKDNDGVKDAVDNCPNFANPLQEDDDSDGVGNVCENSHYKYPGKSFKIPGVIEVPFFDLGGEGKAYHDSKAGVENTTIVSPRTYKLAPEDVEVDATGIGYIRNGEWVKYTIDSINKGIYTINVSSASASQNANYQISLNDIEIASISANATGNWDDVQEFSVIDVKIENELTNAVLKVMFVNTAVTTKDLCNFKALSFEKTGELTAAGLLKVGSEKRFSISPNPARNSFSINAKNVTIKNMIIRNAFGMTVYEQAVSNASSHNNIIVNADFANGIYFVSVTDSRNKVYSDKLIIQ